MPSDKIAHVIDTNVIIDFPQIILGTDGESPTNPTVDLGDGHIIIPTMGIRQLEKFKNEKSDRGKACREVLRHLRKLFEGKISTMSDIYNLRAPISTNVGTQILSILPVHQNFCNCLSFRPADDDADGQIILTALAAAFALGGLRVDGNELKGKVDQAKVDQVVLLTNDDCLAIRARERGIRTMRYGYQYPEPYTGRRDLIVPSELFREFYTGRRLERVAFEEMMPGEPKLIANEFVVMQSDDPSNYPLGFDPTANPYFENIGRYDAEEDAILPLKHVNRFPIWPKNPGQAIYAEALADPDFAAVVCTGPAGSGKTFMATIYAYLASRRGDYAGIAVVPCENRTNIGALPGDLNDKMEPDVAPMKDALINYFLNECSAQKKDRKKSKKNSTESAEEVAESAPTEEDNGRKSQSQLKRAESRMEEVWQNWFTSVPIGAAHGRTFSHQIAIYDEFQDQSPSQADTLIKRLGTKGKIVLTGDVEQIHAPYLDTLNNGLVYAGQQLLDNPMVAQVSFTEEEVVRHPLVKEIARRQREAQKTVNNR